MTILSVVGGKGPGPIEGEEPERAARTLCQNTLTAEELGFFNKVKEFLGSSVNEQMLVQTIKSHGSSQPHLSGSQVLNDVISLYFDRMETELDKPNKQVRFDEHLEVPSPAPPPGRSYPYSFNTRGTTMEGPKEVIDLASDEDKSVQKWENVPQSLVGNREEQDVIKAIEESLKDNQSVPGSSFFAQRDPENPYERRRTGLTPVGLKNIGNSCWFNVIVQTLFHIPRFRQMLFNATSKCRTINNLSPWKNELGHFSTVNTSVSASSLLFSLRRLAACLKASSRAYVDPTDLLKIISELNTNLNKAVPCIGIQQDATEMLLRLIEWLEQAFKEELVLEGQLFEPNAFNIIHEEVMETNEEAMVSSGSNSGQTLTPGGESSSDDLTSDDLNSNAVSEHPFNSLFYGSHIEIRPNADGTPSSLKLANSLQMINLDVTYDNLYDSLEAYHLSDAPAKELWFDSLPPVIIFSLVRFSYKNGQTEKIHSQFQFPRDMYMDRYLFRNRTFVSERRIERNALKKRLAHAKCELEGWEKFPAGEMKLPLPLLIDAVMRYASSAINGTYNQQLMEVCDETAPSSVAIPDLPNLTMGSSEIKEENAISSSPYLDKSIIPADVDIGVVTRFLQILSADAQKRIDELQKEANMLQENIDSIFDVDGMREEPYRLHGVIVHEGEANVGHYWAYIASSPLSNDQNKEVPWRKFNDKSVEPATWQQIEEDSFGSRRACSAYCLVYTRKKCEDALYGQEQYQPAKTITELVDSLPSDLKLDVSADNALFDAEMIKWDTDHSAVKFGSKSNVVGNPSKNLEMLELVSFKNPLNFALLTKRHYEHSARFFGALMLKSALEAMNVTDCDLVLEREESAFSLIQELITNCMGHYEKARKMSTVLYNDRLMFMVDWAAIFGVPLSHAARSIYLLRVMLHLDASRYPKFMLTCENVVEKCIADNPSAEVILNDAHVLYELFCQMLALMNDIMKKVDLTSSSRLAFPLEIQQSRLLCLSIRTMEKIDMFATEASSDMEQKRFFYLVHNALLIIYVIRISECLIERIGDECNDTVLAENENFLDKEYKAMIVRLHRMDNDASETTIQYVVSIWNQLLSNSNGLQRVPRFYQKIMDASEQKTVSNMPASKLNIRAVNFGHDLFLLRQAMRSNLEVRNVEDLNILVRTVIHGKSITSDTV